jgi:hypothetical protein
MRKVIRLTVIVVSITLIFQNCIYEFTPSAGKLENLLVIYGMVTNENGPHEITILKTKTINSKVNETVSGAKVSIIDDKGNTVPLAEDSVGKYHTPETFAGQIGAKYKLNIELQEGKQYESDYVELLDVPDISELEAEKITKPATGTSLESGGYQFYISTKPGTSEQKYYKWDVFEDWEYRLPFVISAYWDGTVLYQIDPLPNKCYMHTQFNDIYISTTKNFQTNYITHYPLNFTPGSSKFVWKYGIYVRQYALSEFSYNFWYSAMENNQPDPLYSKQPYQLIGNIKCISNPDETVFGIFEASAVKSKGITASYLSEEGQYDHNCPYYITVIQGVQPQDIMNKPAGWVGESGPDLIIVSKKECVFCKSNGGGTGIRPDYFGENGLKNEQ